MGQYFIPTIIDVDGNIQTLSSHEFQSGSKLTEHSWIGNEFVNAVFSLIHENRKHIAWIGDYSADPYEGTDDIYAKAMPYSAFMKYYDAAWGEDSEKKYKVSPDKFTETELNLLSIETTDMYLVNHDRSEYINLAEYIQMSKVTERDDIWCLNPLPLLTACGNDRGGGDFRDGHTGYKYIGLWAFASVEYTSKIPDGYTKRHYKFIED